MTRFHLFVQVSTHGQLGPEQSRFVGETVPNSREQLQSQIRSGRGADDVDSRQWSLVQLLEKLCRQIQSAR